LIQRPVHPFSVAGLLFARIGVEASAHALHVNVRRVVCDLGLIDAERGQTDAYGDGDGGNDPFGHGNLPFVEVEIVQIIATNNVNAVTDAK
jgi:hypothetical protein